MIFLCDVDEVLADFSGPLLDAAERMFGVRHPIAGWDLFAPFTREQASELHGFASRRGFCRDLPVLPGAQDAIHTLRTEGCVIYALTSPLNSPTWAHERQLWLAEHFAIDKSHIISTGAKSLVRGDFFLDDNPEHVSAWHKARTDALQTAMLFDCAFNAHDRLLDSFRKRGWSSVVEEVARQRVVG